MRFPKTTKTEVTQPGRVKRVSVAVVVDGSYSRNDKGEIVYKPRSKEEIDQIAALVRSAIGFDQKRGDQVEVANLRFAEPPAQPITAPTGWLSALQFSKDDIMRADDMQAMGPVRLREVDEAQALLVNLAKDLAAKGEIVISKSRGEEELIY